MLLGRLLGDRLLECLNHCSIGYAGVLAGRLSDVLGDWLMDALIGKQTEDYGRRRLFPPLTVFFEKSSLVGCHGFQKLCPS